MHLVYWDSAATVLQSPAESITLVITHIKSWCLFRLCLGLILVISQSCYPIFGTVQMMLDNVHYVAMHIDTPAAH